MKKSILISLTIVSFIILFVTYIRSAQPLFIYTMVNVNINTQGDAHLIELPNGKVVLIYAGYSSQAVKSLVPLLKRKDIRAIDLFFVSHAHRDHYEGAFNILDAGIEIKRLLVHRPPNLQSICKADCCCQYSSFLKLTQMLPVSDLSVGQKIDLADDVWLRIIDLWKTGDSVTDINDTSVIMKLETAKYSILFTGDLNKKRSERLVGNVDLKANILKLPHHGADSMAVSAFHETVNAEVFFAPSPENLWFSDRASRSRKIAEENNIETFVNGLHGMVTLTGYANYYAIQGDGKSYKSKPNGIVFLPAVQSLLNGK